MLTKTNRNPVLRKVQYATYLTDASRVIDRLKGKADCGVIETQSMFNLARMYLDHAEEQLV